MQTNYARTTAPKVCDECGSPHVKLTTNRALYGRRAIDPEATIYGCMQCRASVGVHQGTIYPLGRMADAHTRALRARAHLEFDAMWKHGKLSRSQAYTLLRTELGIEESEAHMAMMTREQLQEVINWAQHRQSAEEELRRRRKDKKDDRRIKRAARDAKLEAIKRREKQQESRKRDTKHYRYG